jgi:hypothetical protein
MPGSSHDLMTSPTRISGSDVPQRSRVRLAVTVIATLAGLALTGCIPSAARSASPAIGAGPSASPSPVPAPTGPTPIPSFVRPTPTPAPTFLVYVVKTGDSLERIADRFGTTGRSIAYWNRGTYPSLNPESPSYKPNLIRIGWTLALIPNATVDEQTLPQPTPNPTDPSEAEPTES